MASPRTPSTVTRVPRPQPVAEQGHPAKQASASRTAEPPGPLPIEEIYSRYPGEWVVVKVTALDEGQSISHAQVLAHSPSRKKVSTALLRAHRDDPTVRTYLFFGGPEAGTTEEWREQLAEAARLGGLNARW